ncbi:unnamed protein product [Lactuca virosa]|uniref:t-SNARE coiled-coil homology domain-containing protein n=1 Tax=Lactuca virosa TaxID=75947 RepID=A0AAU9P0U8_9ASTR|nr:unnamed protein product [Lactuca virosa]
MAGEKGGGKETGGAQLKRMESLETELGILYDRLETQGNQIQHQADSIASIQLKMDQRFQESFNKRQGEESNGGGTQRYTRCVSCGDT